MIANAVHFLVLVCSYGPDCTHWALASLSERGADAQ